MLKVAIEPIANIVKLDPLSSLELRLEESIRLTGRFNGKPALVYQVLGRRAGFTSTSIYNDVVEFANSTAEIPALLITDALEIVSSSVNDAAAGTGVRTVKVVYIDHTGSIVSATLTLNGTTAVAAGFTANEILYMYATSVGSGLVAAGDIRLRVVAGPVECEQISTGRNRSRSARFMVPTGYTGYIKRITLGAAGTTIDHYVRAQTDIEAGIYSAAYVELESDYIPTGATKDKDLPMLQIPANGRVKVSVIAGATASTNIADVDFGLILVKN